MFTNVMVREAMQCRRVFGRAMFLTNVCQTTAQWKAVGRMSGRV